MVELHEVVMKDGEMVMQPKEGGIPIPAGGSATLEPGGDHIMLMDVTEPIEPGDVVELDLELSDGSTLTMTAIAKEFSGADEDYSPSRRLDGLDRRWLTSRRPPTVPDRRRRLRGRRRGRGRDAGRRGPETPALTSQTTWGDDTLPFWGAHQPGIETPAQAAASTVIALDLRDGVDREARWPAAPALDRRRRAADVGGAGTGRHGT